MAIVFEENRKMGKYRWSRSTLGSRHPLSKWLHMHANIMKWQTRARARRTRRRRRRGKRQRQRPRKTEFYMTCIAKAYFSSNQLDWNTKRMHLHCNTFTPFRLVLCAALSMLSLACTMHTAPCWIWSKRGACNAFALSWAGVCWRCWLEIVFDDSINDNSHWNCIICTQYEHVHRRPSHSSTHTPSSHHHQCCDVKTIWMVGKDAKCMNVFHVCANLKITVYRTMWILTRLSKILFKNSGAKIQLWSFSLALCGAAHGRAIRLNCISSQIESISS